jgi:4-amino-4-deoxy-L-arabinose transferase-like glycosyltransferase
MGRVLLDRPAAWAIGLILLGALALRLWGIDYGLPVSYWQDEYLEVMRALQLGTGGFDLDRTEKGGLYLVMFVEYGVYFVILKLSGAISSTAEFARLFVNDPSVFYLLGRITTAVLGSVTVLAAYLIGRTAYSIGAGLLAALFLAVNVLHVEMSHMINVDIMMVCFAGLALFFALRIAACGQLRDYVIAGAMAGIATTAKIPAMLLVIPLLIAHIHRMRQSETTLAGWFRSGNFWLGAVTLAGILILTNPGIVFAIPRYLSYFAAPPETAVLAPTDGAVELPGERPNLFVYYLAAMPRAMGWPLTIVAALGVVRALWARSIADTMLVAFALATFVVISITGTDLYYERYALPVMFVLSVLAARVVCDVGKVSPRRWGPIAAAVGLLLVASPAQLAVQRTRLLTEPDNRTFAQHWIEANVPAGATVLIEGARFAPNRTGVALEESVDGLKRRIAYWKGRDARAVTYLQHKLAAAEGVRYDLVLVNLRSLGSLDQYRAMGVEYFVILPRRFLEHRQTSAGALSLVEELRTAPDVELMQEFPADLERRRGPTVEIYRIKPM